MQIIDEQGLLQNAVEMGFAATEMLNPLVGTAGVYDVRGNGLMLAVELRDGNGNPDYERCDAVKAEARRNGLLLLTCGARIGKSQTDCAALRIIPPLNVDRASICCGINTLIQALLSVPATVPL
jgi:4-aminobutyrate aminotransferase-like enzyme